MKVKLLSCVRLLATLWSAAYQAPPPLGFARQEYWGGVPLPSPGDHTQTGLILGSQFCSFDLWLFFFPVSTMLFWLLWLCISLKSGSWITSALFFFLEITLAIWGRLWFHANFRIFILFLWNVFWILIDCNLYCSLNL